MPRSKYHILAFILELVLLIAGVIALFGVLLFVLDERNLSTWPFLITPVFIISVAGIMLYNRHSHSKLNRLAATFRFERSLYREALLFNCDYAYTVNLTKNTISAVHRVGMLEPYNFHTDAPYDEAIVNAMKDLAPRMLYGDKDLYLSQHYQDAYSSGKRMLQLDYYLKQDDSYKQKTVFLTKNHSTGDLFAFIALHDVSEKMHTKEQTKASLMELTDVAKQIATGDLDVNINCSVAGDVGVLAQSLQNTADKLRIYINSIQDLAKKDSMTSMENRTAYAGAIAELDIRLKKGEQLSFSAVMFDLDGLKRINDMYGHNEGDKYIVTASDLIRQTIPDAMCFRIGGDEFAAILFDLTLADIEALSKQFEENIRKHNQTSPIKISISHGYAIYNPQKDKSFADVYARADAEMYACKDRKRAQQ